ncbi:hypothetical protein GCM10027168_62380 [Streptomyces capparidis]
MHHSATLPAAAGLVVLALAGCGGGGDAEPTRTVTATVTAVPSDEPPHDGAAPPRRSPVTPAAGDVRKVAGEWVTDALGAKVYRVRYTVRNSGSKPADYVIAFEMLDRKGDRVGEVYDDVTALGPGQSVRATAEHHPEHETSARSARAVDVKVLKAERMRADE